MLYMLQFMSSLHLLGLRRSTSSVEVPAQTNMFSQRYQSSLVLMVASFIASDLP